VEPSQWLSIVQRHRAIAVIHASQSEIAGQMAAAAVEQGMRLLEVTWSSDRPMALVEMLRQQFPDSIVGAGTVQTFEDLEEAIAAGAEFVFSPHTDLTLLESAHRAHLPIIPGALTPTEIMTAWRAGAASVKVFPIQAMGGPSYLRCLQRPLAGIPLIATGGVSIDTAHQFLEAGAVAIALASELFPPDAIAQKDWNTISQRIKTLMQNLQPFCV